MRTLMLALVLALCSFAFGRYQYTNKNSTTLTNPFGNHESTTVSNPLMDKSLFGHWVQDEWLFTMAIPGILILGGLALSTRK